MFRQNIVFYKVPVKVLNLTYLSHSSVNNLLHVTVNDYWWNFILCIQPRWIKCKNSRMITYRYSGHTSNHFKGRVQFMIVFKSYCDIYDLTRSTTGYKYISARASVQIYKCSQSAKREGYICIYTRGRQPELYKCDLYTSARS